MEGEQNFVQKLKNKILRKISQVVQLNVLYSAHV